MDYTVRACHSDALAATVCGVVECEQPTPFFDKFVGTVRLGSAALQPQPQSQPQSQPHAHVTGAVTGEALGAEQTLLRGCVLMNTACAYGLVVYTGDETKVRVKQQEVHTKRASVEAVINSNVIGLVLILLAICTMGAAGSAVFGEGDGVDHWYLSLGDVTGATVVQTFFTYFLLNASFVPVSLYVSMRLVRSFQKLFMEWDE